MTPTTLNKNVYPQAFHRHLLSPCLITGSALGTVSTRSNFSSCQVLQPFHAIVLALADEAVEFLTVLGVPALDERGVDRAEDVAVEPGVELDKDSGKRAPSRSLDSHQRMCEDHATTEMRPVSSTDPCRRLGKNAYRHWP